jgi:S1-C subfamily serine protease
MKGPTPMKNNGWIEVRRPIAAMILLLALGIGGVAGLWITGRRSSQGVNILLSTASAAVSDQVSFTSGFTPVVDRVLPSVVNISSAKIVRFADSGPPFFFDPFLHEFCAALCDVRRHADCSGRQGDRDERVRGARAG